MCACVCACVRACARACFNLQTVTNDKYYTANQDGYKKAIMLSILDSRPAPPPPFFFYVFGVGMRATRRVKALRVNSASGAGSTCRTDKCLLNVCHCPQSRSAESSPARSRTAVFYKLAPLNGGRRSCARTCQPLCTAQQILRSK